MDNRYYFDLLTRELNKIILLDVYDFRYLFDISTPNDILISDYFWKEKIIVDFAEI